MEQVKGIKEEQASADAAVTDIATQRDEAIMTIGNLVHDSVPVDDDEVRPPATCVISKGTSVHHPELCPRPVYMCVHRTLAATGRCTQRPHATRVSAPGQQCGGERVGHV